MALKFLGLGKPTSIEHENNTVRAFPAEWFISEELYQLERRAIFSKRWLLTTHRNRFKDTGHWLQYEIAGYKFLIVKDRKGNIDAFHNVCRHRAYPVVEGVEGKSSIFACKYHGWCYGLDGKLAKAPGYQDLSSFDKGQNGLFKIHVQIDANGFIWVNLDGKEKPEVSWEHDFLGGDTQSRLAAFNFDDYVYDHSWELDANYNWKLAADNFNECYHCKTTHPDIPDVVDLSSYSVDIQRRWLHHNGSTERETTDEQKQKGLSVASTYYWPNISMNASKNFMFTQRFIPRGPQKTLIKYEVYRRKNAPEEDFKMIDGMYKRVMMEDKVLCNAAQNNINTGVFVNGEMHPVLEKGPLFVQKLIRDDVTAHYLREQAAKQEIWPARQVLPSNAASSQKDIEFCGGLGNCHQGLAKEEVAF